MSDVAMTDLDEGDKVLHGLDDLSDSEVLKDILTDADDLPHLRLIKGQQQR